MNGGHARDGDPGFAPLHQQGLEGLAQQHSFQFGMQRKDLKVRFRSRGREAKQRIGNSRFVDTVAAEQLIEGRQGGGYLRTGTRSVGEQRIKRRTATSVARVLQVVFALELEAVRVDLPA